MIFQDILLQKTCSVADHDIVNLGSVSEFLGELIDCRGNESFVKFILYEVDGTSAESSTHNPGAGNIVLAGEFIEEIKFFAADFIQTAESEMSLIHHFSYGLVITSLQSVAHIKDPLDFTDDILSAEEILLRNLIPYLVEPYPLGVAQEFNLRMILTDGCGGILARSPSLVVR